MVPTFVLVYGIAIVWNQDQSEQISEVFSWIYIVVCSLTVQKKNRVVFYLLLLIGAMTSVFFQFSLQFEYFLFNAKSISMTALTYTASGLMILKL